MPKNFTQYAFTDSVKSLQKRYQSRLAYQRMELSGDRYQLGAGEIAFVQSRDSFFMSTIGENGWPYLQHRGGAAGFLKVVDATTLRFGDYAGNRQFISAGNIQDNGKACLFLIDYPTQQRLKIWAEVEMQFAEDAPDIAAELEGDGSPTVERIFTLKTQAFDWNCPKYIPKRYSLEEIRSAPNLMAELLTKTN